MQPESKMMRPLGWLASAGLLALLVCPRSQAAEPGSLEETLETLSADAAASYLSPISSAFGANLNSGWFRRAPQAKKLGFSFEAGMVLMGSFFPTDAGHFSVNGDFRLSSSEANFLLDEMENQQGGALPSFVRDALIEEITSQYTSVGISGATVIGAASDSVTIAFPGATYSAYGLDYDVPAAAVKLPFGGFGDLADVPLLPLTVPQFSLGTFYGTNFTVRWLPAVELSPELGDYKYSGFGIQHNPAIWMDRKLPVDLALSFFTQSMKVGNLFDCKATAFGVTASKQWGWRFLNLTPYAGFLLESAEMGVTYDLMVPVPVSALYPDGVYTEKVDITLESENSSRLVLGTNLRLGIVNWNLDYSLAKYSGFSTGISLAF
ncbi:MAG: hypothetical protein KC518_00030 [Candidatus Cloacimonetes bacterium]|nr:hypothetical protein [Candidatus Cloacimonadota bacterium]